MPDTQVPSVDLAAINAEIGKLSPTQLAEQLLKVRVRNKVQQKKQYAKGTMKQYQQRGREKFKAMKETALNTKATAVDPTTGHPFPNLWEQINAQAEEQAEAKVAADAEAGGTEETEAEPETL